MTPTYQQHPTAIRTASECNSFPTLPSKEGSHLWEMPALSSPFRHRELMLLFLLPSFKIGLNFFQVVKCQDLLWKMVEECNRSHWRFTATNLGAR